MTRQQKTNLLTCQNKGLHRRHKKKLVIRKQRAHGSCEVKRNLDFAINIKLLQNLKLILLEFFIEINNGGYSRNSNLAKQRADEVSKLMSGVRHNEGRGSEQKKYSKERK